MKTINPRIQSHRQQIEKRVYKIGDIIPVSAVVKITKYVYSRVIRKFRITSIEQGIFHGVYVD